MTEITMPRLSDAMEEGTILIWLKAAGEHVDNGDELVEIETDKATMTYQSPQQGHLEIVAEAGTTLPVGAVIARVGVAPAQPIAPAQQPPELRADGAPSADSDPEPVSPSAGVATNGNRTIRATPLARRLAGAHDIDLSSLSGSGPRGRIRRADVERAAGVVAVTPRVTPAETIRSQPQTTAPTSGAPEPGQAKGHVTVVQPTRLAQVIARRMSEAKATIPEFQVEAEVNFDAAIALRGRLKEQAGERAPSFNDLIVKACGLALRDHPRANGSYRDGRFELYGRINVGVAVAATEALVVPTVTDADTRSLGSIAAETQRLAARVRDGQISPAELASATFTVSNLGMYGMSAITPVINPPQAAILGVGTTRAVPAVIDGELTERHLLTLRLSCDHRILYGADAAEFLAAIRGYLERPLTLAL